MNACVGVGIRRRRSILLLPDQRIYLTCIPRFFRSLKTELNREDFMFRYLSGAYPGGWAIFPEARRNWGVFERYQGVDDEFRLGITVRMGHADWGHPQAMSILLDPNSTTTLSDAPLLENEQLSIGGVIVRSVRGHN